MNQRAMVPQELLATLKILWLGVLFTPVIFLVIAWILLGNARAEEFSLSDSLVLALGFIAVLFYGTANKIPELFARGGLRSQAEQPHEFETGKVLSIFAIRLALFEGIGVLGLVLALVRQSLLLLLPFVFLSLIGLLASRPTERLIRRLTGEPHA